MAQTQLNLCVSLKIIHSLLLAKVVESFLLLIIKQFMFVEIISFVFFFTAIAMLLHVILAYIMYAKTILKHSTKLFNERLKVIAALIIIFIVILTIKSFTNGTELNAISDIMNGIVIGFLVNNIYRKYL